MDARDKMGLEKTDNPLVEYFAKCVKFMPRASALISSFLKFWFSCDHVDDHLALSDPQLKLHINLMKISLAVNQPSSVSLPPVLQSS